MASLTLIMITLLGLQSCYGAAIVIANQPPDVVDNAVNAQPLMAGNSMTQSEQTHLSTIPSITGVRSSIVMSSGKTVQIVTYVITKTVYAGDSIWIKFSTRMNGKAIPAVNKREPFKGNITNLRGLLYGNAGMLIRSAKQSMSGVYRGWRNIETSQQSWQIVLHLGLLVLPPRPPTTTTKAPTTTTVIVPTTKTTIFATNTTVLTTTESQNTTIPTTTNTELTVTSTTETATIITVDETTRTGEIPTEEDDTTTTASITDVPTFATSTATYETAIEQSTTQAPVPIPNETTGGYDRRRVLQMIIAVLIILIILTLIAIAIAKRTDWFYGSRRVKGVHKTHKYSIRQAAAAARALDKQEAKMINRAAEPMGYTDELMSCLEKCCGRLHRPHMYSVNIDNAIVNERITVDDESIFDSMITDDDAHAHSNYSIVTEQASMLTVEV